ncbi:MAG: sulfotransferase [Flavobacteriales bacterium]|nr:sulfotransferase [Flavobacteriales bacterium]
MRSNDPAPIFLVGSERSGSNLLRSLLGNHSRVEAPVAPHYFDSWSGMLHHYGDLRVERNMAYLLQDMMEFANHDFNKWGLRLDVAEALREHQPKSFWDAFDVIYRAKARMHGKPIYACKGNHIFNYAFQVKARWPESRLLYLYRDPRDHCASWKKKPAHLRTVWDSMRKWESEQRRCLELVKRHGVDMHFISYEDLISDTPQVMAGALRFCGLPVEENCFQTDSEKQQETARRFVYWENIDKPIIRDNAKKYRRDLTPQEIEMIETRAGSVMEELGYEFDTRRAWRPPFAHAFRLKMERRRVTRRDRGHYEKELGILRSKLELRREIGKRAASRKDVVR